MKIILLSLLITFTLVTLECAVLGTGSDAAALNLESQTWSGTAYMVEYTDKVIRITMSITLTYMGNNLMVGSICHIGTIPVPEPPEVPAPTMFLNEGVIEPPVPCIEVISENSLTGTYIGNRFKLSGADEFGVILILEGTLKKNAMNMTIYSDDEFAITGTLFK